MRQSLRQYQTGVGRSGYGAKLKELMLRGSLSGEPRYASILWADNQGISSEIFRSLSSFIRSRGAEESMVQCPPVIVIVIPTRIQTIEKCHVSR